MSSLMRSEMYTLPSASTLATSPVRPTDTNISFTTTLSAGSHQLAPVFTTADGKEVGAYYAVVTKIP